MINKAEFNYGRNINPVTHEGGLSKIDIMREQKFIIDQFSQFYSEHGYQQFPSEGLIPKEDKTVIFTGATITPLKKFLVEELSSPGYFVVQKCLRTKRLKEMTDLNKIPDWTNYFTMCGILSGPDRIAEVSNEAYELLTERLCIDKTNILVQASSKDKDLSKYWNDFGIIVEEDVQIEESYRWSYGMPDTAGRGINLLLRYGKNYTYRELGNVISIEDSSNKIRGYEFGFGLESLLSTLHGFKSPMEASIVSIVIPYGEGVKEKYVDALATAIVLYHHGIKPGRTKEEYILKEIVKGISYLRRQMKISLDQIKEDGKRFEEVEFGKSSTSAEKLTAGIIVYENKLLKFIAYAKNLVYAYKLRRDVDEKLLTKLKKEGINMGILPSEIDRAIKNVLS